MNKPLLIAVLVINIVLHATPAPVTVAASPRFQLYHKNTQEHLLLTLPRNPLNRALCIEVDGPTFWSECVDFVGLGASYAVERWVSGLQAGHYAVAATLTQVSGRKFTATTSFVICGDEGCEDGMEP